MASVSVVINFVPDCRCEVQIEQYRGCIPRGDVFADLSVRRLNSGEAWAVKKVAYSDQM